MSEKITLDLPEDLAQRIRTTATRSHRSLEDILIEYIERGALESPVDSLSDDEVLTLCQMEMDETQQEELGRLLEGQREGSLGLEERGLLEQLMRVYRRGLVRKAQALRVAVERGLQGPVE